MKKILVIGGAGYVGCELVPKLLNKNYVVTVYDLMIYGNNLPINNKNLLIIKGDVRDLEKLKQTLRNHDAVIHLACISNDPSFELNPKLGREINFDCFEPLVLAAKEAGIKHFIYASSSSVYGVKDTLDVTEEASLEPLTDYSKFKAQCEKILNSYNDENFSGVTIRPATVCGYSKRQRLDVIVNILTNVGFHKKEISVFGGDQLRPNIHIKDMVRAYEKLIEADNKLVSGQIFNAGWENKSVNEIAKTVKSELGENVNLVVTPTNDNRSYHISSEKIKRMLNFQTEFTISDAVNDLKKAFELKLLNDPLNNPDYFNIKKMQLVNLK